MGRRGRWQQAARLLGVGLALILGLAGCEVLRPGVVTVPTWAPTALPHDGTPSAATPTTSPRSGNPSAATPTTSPRSGNPSAAGPTANPGGGTPPSVAGIAPTGAEQPDPAATDAPPRFEPRVCWFNLPADTVVRCGTVTVPADRRRPLDAGNRIDLAIAILPAPEDPPLPDPVFILVGGPGEAATDQVDWHVSLWRPVAGNRDIVLVDQRGTGRTRPSLDCPEHDVAACYRRLTGEGIDLSTYTTPHNAADFEDVRRALGYAQINLVAGSYGTHLALAIMRDHPWSVRSAVLDGVVPPQIHLDPDMIGAFARALGVLFADCAAQPACARAYPELEATLVALVTRLDATPLTVTATGGPYVVDDRAFLDLLFESLHHREALPYLPCLIACTAEGDTDMLRTMIEAFWAPRGTLTQPDLAEHISEGMQYSVWCAEEVAYQSHTEFLAAALAFDPALRPAVLHSFRSYHRICEAWPVPPGDPIEEEPVVSDIPVLLLSGDYDPACSPAWATLAAETLSRHAAYILPATGHVTWRTSTCARQVIAQFLATPLAEPDATCVAEMRAPVFGVR